MTSINIDLQSHAVPDKKKSQEKREKEIRRPPFHSDQRPYSSPRLSRTHLRTRFLNSLGSSRHRRAASTFAGLSSFGLDSMEITERRIVSGVCTGDQRSAADS